MIENSNNPKISLGQAGSLRDIWLKTNPNITAHWDIDASVDAIYQLSNNQKKLIIALIHQKEYTKLNGVLENLGFKRK
jgi:hypothetical protein